MLIQPGGREIAHTTYQTWCDKNGLSSWDTLTPAQAEEVNRIAESDPVTLAEVAENQAWIAEKAASDAAKQSAIARITDGLDRETVMGMAPKVIRDPRGYWPEIDGDALIVRNPSDQMIVWSIGDDGWSKPISTQGSRQDTGGGYGSNQ